MKPDFDALADLLLADKIAASLTTADVQVILDSRRSKATLLVQSWLDELSGQGLSVWAVLDHQERDAYEQLKRLFTRPFSIDQADFGHCGPAAMLAVLFHYFPNTMARFARDMIKSGNGQLGNNVISAPEPMSTVTIEDIESVLQTQGVSVLTTVLGTGSPEEHRRSLVPETLTWILLSVIQYAASEDDADIDGLKNDGTGMGGLLTARMNTLLKSTGLVKDLKLDSPFSDLDHPDLVTKKDNPLREIFLGCDARFLDKSDGMLPGFLAHHFIWLKSYARVGTQVDLTYYTWGEMVTRKYDATLFKSHANYHVTFTIKIDAMD